MPSTLWNAAAQSVYPTLNPTPWIRWNCGGKRQYSMFNSTRKLSETYRIDSKVGLSSAWSDYGRERLDGQEESVGPQIRDLSELDKTNTLAQYKTKSVAAQQITHPSGYAQQENCQTAAAARSSWVSRMGGQLAEAQRSAESVREGLFRAERRVEEIEAAIQEERDQAYAMQLAASQDMGEASLPTTAHRMRWIRREQQVERSLQDYAYAMQVATAQGALVGVSRHEREQVEMGREYAKQLEGEELGESIHAVQAWQTPEDHAAHSPCWVYEFRHGH
ncbi:hypothetical protein K438DRAFT_1747974 [Mycena galopus ATCC 62051]|nr:hypothetical protein K438DRAFT_1747974 [Mycena galopus ATCC 62051]